MVFCKMSSQISGYWSTFFWNRLFDETIHFQGVFCEMPTQKMGGFMKHPVSNDYRSIDTNFRGPSRDILVGPLRGKFCYVSRDSEE